MIRIGIVAGELSGDLLGAGLIRSVLKKYPNIQFEGIAGPEMLKAGCDAWYEAEELAVMGLFEVIKDLPRLLKIKKSLCQRWLDNPPDLFIGIDAPDFNLRVAKQLKTNGIHTMHYVSPSVWAWREGRVKTIEKAVDDLFCLLPFEPKYYKNTTVNAHFIGHPMADSIQARSLQNDPLIPNPKIAVLPGSRQGEIKKLAIPFIQCIAQLAQRYPTATFTIPAAKLKLVPQLEILCKQYAPGVKVEITLGQTSELLHVADCALIASGTATLEAMLHNCPMVVGYQMSELTVGFLYLINALKTKYFALPNILADEFIVPEILQKELTSERLTQEMSELLDNPDKRQSMQTKFAELYEVLKKDTDQTVANIVIETLKSKNKLQQYTLPN